MRINQSVIFIALAFASNAAFSEPLDVKPGLWETTTTTAMSSMLPIDTSNMPPEQKARIEAAMKNMAGSPHTTAVKSCVTREGIDKAIADANSTKTNTCAPKLVSASASKVRLHIDCTREGGNMKSNGDMTIERTDSEHFKGTGAMKSTGANGRNMDMKWSMTGTFVSSDCGKVKPAGQ
jgi:hypothetical protein